MVSFQHAEEVVEVFEFFLHREAGRPGANTQSGEEHVYWHTRQNPQPRGFAYTTAFTGRPGVARLCGRLATRLLAAWTSNWKLWDSLAKAIG